MTRPDACADEHIYPPLHTLAALLRMALTLRWPFPELPDPLEIIP
jgi:hypothetical protein